MQEYYQSIAAAVNELDNESQQKSWLTSGELARQYPIELKSVGGSLESLFTDGRFEELITVKIATGLFQ